MPYRIRIDPVMGYVLARFEGTVDAEQLDAVRTELEQHADFRPGLDRIWDQRDCELAVTGTDLTELALRWSQSARRHGSRRVAYFIRDGLRWGLNRQFEAQREDPDVHFALFTSWPEVKVWLELPADLPDPETLLDATA